MQHLRLCLWLPFLNCMLADTAGLMAFPLPNRLEFFSSQDHVHSLLLKCLIIGAPSERSSAHSPAVSSFWIMSLFTILINVWLRLSLVAVRTLTFCCCWCFYFKTRRWEYAYLGLDMNDRFGEVKICCLRMFNLLIKRKIRLQEVTASLNIFLKAYQQVLCHVIRCLWFSWKQSHRPSWRSSIFCRAEQLCTL